MLGPSVRSSLVTLRPMSPETWSRAEATETPIATASTASVTMPRRRHSAARRNRASVTSLGLATEHRRRVEAERETQRTERAEERDAEGEAHRERQEQQLERAALAEGAAAHQRRARAADQPSQRAAGARDQRGLGHEQPRELARRGAE